MSSGFYASYVALWVLVCVMALLVALLYRHFGLMAMGTAEGVQRDGLPIGSEAPGFRGTLASGVDVSWRPTGKAAFLIFASPSCEPCAVVLPYVRSLALSRSVTDRLEFVAAVGGGTHRAAEQFEEKFGLPFTCIAEGAAGVFSAYRVRVTPFAFVISEDGRILSKGLCNSAARLRVLLESGGLAEIGALVHENEQNEQPKVVPQEVAV